MEEDKKNLHRVKFLDYKIDSGVTYYSISVTTLATSESWIFQSRYRNMLDLHNQISTAVNIKLPAFPPKKWPGNLNLEFISQRQKSLENYFNTLLRVVNLDNLPILKNFLYTSYKKKEEKIVNKPEIPTKKPEESKKKEEEKQQIVHNVIKPNFDKIVENTKFVDLNTNMASPDEDEVKEKKEKYKTLNFNLKLKFPKMLVLPENKLLKLEEFLNKESFPNKEPGFVKELKGCMESLLVNMESFDQFSMKTQMIHCFQP